MANTLTAVARVLYSAARTVPRELTGILGAVSLNFDDKGVAKGDTIKVPIVPALTNASVTPSATFAAGSDRTPTTANLTLSQMVETSWHLTAEEERSLASSQIGQDMLKQTVEQAFRALVNGVESHVWGVARANASRAFGTAGTTPFASDLSALTNARKILADNGAPMTDLSLVCDTAAGLNLRNLTQLQKVNEAGDGSTLRDGSLGNLFGFGIRESAAIVSTTKGTGSGYLVNNGSGYAVGATSITVDTGSGTILAGDVITFAGDTNKYVVKTTLASNVVVIQEPGLKAAVADNTAITVGNNATANIALHRSGVVVVARPALQPDGAVAEQMVLTDPQTRLSALLLRVPQNAQSSWFLRMVYDAFAPNPYAVAQVLG